MARLVLCLLSLCIVSLAVSIDSISKLSNVQVLRRQPRLNHGAFIASVDVISVVQTSVRVEIYISPKFDSNGFEISLLDSENILLFDEFLYDLPVGVSTIVHNLLLPTGAVDGTFFNMAVYIQNQGSSAFIADGQVIVLAARVIPEITK